MTEQKSRDPDSVRRHLHDTQDYAMFDFSGRASPGELLEVRPSE
jgi:hypothetical protein